MTPKIKMEDHELEILPKIEKKVNVQVRFHFQEWENTKCYSSSDVVSI